MSADNTYEVVDSVVHANDAVINLPEAHGILSGMHCVSDQISLDTWLAAVFETEDQIKKLKDEDRNVLMSVFEQSVHDINDHSARFDLFLPDDDYPLLDRIESLGEWCRGFLYGLGAVKQISSLSSESREILSDLSEIARVEFTVEGEEEDEEAYMELREYIRVAVQLLRVELAQQLEKSESTRLN